MKKLLILFLALGWGEMVIAQEDAVEDTEIVKDRCYEFLDDAYGVDRDVFRFGEVKGLSVLDSEELKIEGVTTDLLTRLELDSSYDIEGVSWGRELGLRDGMGVFSGEKGFERNKYFAKDKKGGLWCARSFYEFERSDQDLHNTMYKHKAAPVLIGFENNDAWLALSILEEYIGGSSGESLGRVRWDLIIPEENAEALVWGMALVEKMSGDGSRSWGEDDLGGGWSRTEDDVFWGGYSVGYFAWQNLIEDSIEEVALVDISALLGRSFFSKEDSDFERISEELPREDRDGKLLMDVFVEDYGEDLFGSCQETSGGAWRDFLQKIENQDRETIQSEWLNYAGLLERCERTDERHGLKEPSNIESSLCLVSQSEQDELNIEKQRLEKEKDGLKDEYFIHVSMKKEGEYDVSKILELENLLRIHEEKYWRVCPKEKEKNEVIKEKGEVESLVSLPNDSKWIYFLFGGILVIIGVYLLRKK